MSSRSPLALTFSDCCKKNSLVKVVRKEGQEGETLQIYVEYDQ